MKNKDHIKISNKNSSYKKIEEQILNHYHLNNTIMIIIKSKNKRNINML